MKDADYGPHETWCDTQNKISDTCNCMVGIYIEMIEDARQELERCKGALVSAYGAMNFVVEHPQCTEGMRLNCGKAINLIYEILKGDGG